jgi:uncharacterized protein (TIGR00290 family)
MRTLLSWSGGKDSALSLQALRSEGSEPVGLLTTYSEPDDVVSHHHVPMRLIVAQAAAVGLASYAVGLPEVCPNEVYEQRMRTALDDPELGGIEAVAFGDLFLEDIRAYREQRMREAGLTARFPLWGIDTARLAQRFVEDGFRAVVCVVDTEQLEATFVGRCLDEDFLDDLPPGVDPCGENGEFHSFVTHGPIFEHPVDVEVGAVSTAGRYARIALAPVGT